jgi:glutamate formiminotransferase/formiminotetrahydrofolate cyclodeaminase
MNLVDIERVGLREAWDAVRHAAARRGIEPTSSEIVGLVPERALRGASPADLRIANFTPELILERHLRHLTRENRQPS